MPKVAAHSYPSVLPPDQPPDIRASKPLPAGEGVLEDSTFRVIEVDKLFDAVNHASTVSGQTVVYRSLAQPLREVTEISAKQEALRELSQHTSLREGVEQLVGSAAKLENALHQLLYGQFIGLMGATAHPLEIEGYGYATYQKGTQCMLDLVRHAAALPVPQSTYLRNLLTDIAQFGQSRSHALMQGPVYRTEKNIITRAEKRFYVPAVRFSPSLFKPVAILMTVVAIMVVATLAPVLLDMAVSFGPLLWLFLLPVSFLYVPVVGGFDRDAFIYPLRDSYRQSPDVLRAVEALGKLDELLSFLRFAENYGHPVCLPQLLDSGWHVLKVQQVRNPVLGKHNPDYVGNDLELQDDHLVFITGPNSGGKTAFCKTLAQVQVLAQTGCYVPAEYAELSVADHVFYQVPEISSLSDGEGRFGTELKRTRDIFLATSARSLVIMDELSEGTTNEEKMDISISVLDGFREKGNNTFLITHNHELVDHYQAKQIGLARQVEFAHDQPTYRVVPGISRVSHADRVARKIGFAKEDIARYLRKK